MRVDIVSLKKIGPEEHTIEEDLIQLRLIEGMYNASDQYKIMEQLQVGNMSLNTGFDKLLWYSNKNWYRNTTIIKVNSANKYLLILSC